jgi:hypothetical protein
VQRRAQPRPPPIDAIAAALARNAPFAAVAAAIAETVGLPAAAVARGEFRSLVPGIWALSVPAGGQLLYGAALANADKLLQRVLGFARRGRAPLWYRAAALDAEAWTYVCAALRASRIQPLLQRGERVLKPLPGKKGGQRRRLGLVGDVGSVHGPVLGSQTQRYREPSPARANAHASPPTCPTL